MLAKLFGRAGPHYVSPGLVDFNAAGLHEYNGCYAVVLDSIFSEAELSAFLAEAEASAPWEVAQVNTGPNSAYTDPTYRNGQRIIYDSFELSEKIFEKVRPLLKDIEEFEEPTYLKGNVKAVQKWRMVRLNERLRFLRYPSGGFFRRHCDGAYLDNKTGQRTFYTLQFYLPSDASGSKQSFVPAEGGTTRFLGRFSKSYADVEAIPGRVLVFQHADLLHTGEEVTSGVKCTVRSDILYERVGEPVPVVVKCKRVTLNFFPANRSSSYPRSPGRPALSRSNPRNASIVRDSPITAPIVVRTCKSGLLGFPKIFS